MIKLILKIVVLLLVFPVIALIAVYGISEYRLNNIDIPPGFEFNQSALVTADVQHGQHVMRTRGCFGCHGQQLQGRVFDEWPWVKRAVAPNLVAYIQNHDLSQFERAVRQGIGQDNKAMWSMPSYNFTRLSDEDVVAMYAYLKQAKMKTAVLAEPEMGWRARYELVMGSNIHMATWAQLVPALQVDPDISPTLARGEYLAMTTCNECHGLDLKGDPPDGSGSPDLTLIIQAYNQADFEHLMRTGEAIGGRSDLGLMSVVAKDRFAYLTQQELDDLYLYLRSLHGVPTP